MSTRKLSEIKIGKRIRKVFDIDSLAESIALRGLLQPVGIRPDNTLVCGERRIRAVKKLEWPEIPVYVCENLEDELAFLEAERDENTEREPLTASEAHELAKKLEPKYAKVASAAADEGRKKGGGDRKSAAAKAERDRSTVIYSKAKRAKTAKEKAATSTGRSASDIRKIGEIKQAAKEDPAFRPIAAELAKKDCKVDGVHKRFVAAKKKLAAMEVAKAIAQAQRANPAPVVYHESFVETATRIDDNSVALIFTDPPYDTESVPMYGELATIASRVLIDGGSLICYCGHRLIPKVIAQMQPSGLSFYWILACIHSGKSARMPLTGQIVTWKPMLWWIKGKERRDTSIMLKDSILSDEPDKETHEWQQGITEATYYIDKLTNEGELIFEPFCGGGTTVVAAKKSGRLTIACDRDAIAVAAAMDRITKEVRGDA